MSVYDILDRIEHRNGHAARMSHPVPKAEVVNRRAFILSEVEGKVVVDIGSAGTDGTGGLFKQMSSKAKTLFGIDKNIPADLDRPNLAKMDLDRDIAVMPWSNEKIDLVVAGEVLEHMTNPGLFLGNLSQYGCPVLLTVPNAFSVNAMKSIGKNVEQVNADHCCWYSWRTLSTLLDKCGYSVERFLWYNGTAPLSEGMIAVCRHMEGGNAARV